MLMSKSRLEKFLYALYSLDSSDLPTPLSRIEELYKCLVTGEEAPTFKPLSRVEKYLMAILGVYDVNELPNPLSRVEVLLYKLATGDDNLDDVKSFLSEHEELLAEIIRNGGAGGNIDIEYVLYTLSTEFNTLYNTAEKPVKSAILKGQTLVNLVKTSSYGGVQSGTCVDGDTGYKVIESIVNTGAIILTRVKTIYPLSPSTVYYLKLTDVAHTNSFLVREQDNGVNLTTEIHDLENKIIKFTTSELGTSDLLFYQRELQVGAKVKYSENLIISNDVESLYSSDDYFTGMKSVQMPVLTTTGKNLLNYSMDNVYTNSSKSNYTPVLNEDGSITLNSCFDEAYWLRKGFYVEKGKNYTVTVTGMKNENQYSSLSFGFDNLKYLGGGVGIALIPAVTKDDCIDTIDTYGTKKMTCTALETGYVTRFYIHGSGLTTKYTILEFQIEEGSVATSYEPFKSNILTVNEDVTLRSNGDVYDELNLLTGRLTQRIDENNEVLAQEVVKTVDLSVVNQDGNDTELSTFDDITHVTLSSEGLIPEAELEVATKNEEVLNTMSLEMDDISTTQNALKETSNTQSENVDATMMATTEIYEQIL